MRKALTMFAIFTLLIVTVSAISCGPPTKEPSERPTVIEFYSAT